MRRHHQTIKPRIARDLKSLLDLKCDFDVLRTEDFLPADLVADDAASAVLNQASIGEEQTDKIKLSLMGSKTHT